jgi:type I restriction enzyme, S subunit
MGIRNSELGIRNWEKAKLGDISDMCLGKMLDKEKNKGELQPYLANINVRWGGFDLTNLNKMRFEEDEHERYGLKHGDLVICEGGEPGRCAIWKEERPNMKFQKALHRVRIKGDYSNEFVYYRFLLARKTGELYKHFIGSTIKHLTGIGLKDVEFAYPDLSTQQKIAAVLSALDAKIELNQRINAELESMAKTLYDYWFVQFEFPHPLPSSLQG